MERYLRALEEYMNNDVKRMYGGSAGDFEGVDFSDSGGSFSDDSDASGSWSYDDDGGYVIDIQVKAEDTDKNTYNFSTGTNNNESGGDDSPGYIDPNAQVPKTVNDLYADIINYLNASPGVSDLEILGVMEEYSSLTGVTMDQLDRALADIGGVEPETMTTRREDATALRDLGSYLTENPEATDAELSNVMQQYSQDTGISLARLDGVIANALGVTAEDIKDRREAADPTLTPTQTDTITVDGTPADTISIGDGDSEITVPFAEVVEEEETAPVDTIAIEDLGFIGEGLQLEPNQVTTIDGQTYLTEEGQYQLGEFAKALRGEPNDFGITKEEAESVLQQGTVYGVPSTTTIYTFRLDPDTGELQITDESTGITIGALPAAPSGDSDQVTEDLGGGGVGGDQSFTEGGSGTGDEEETAPEDTQQGVVDSIIEDGETEQEVGGVETTPEEVELAEDLSDTIAEGLANLSDAQLNEAILAYESSGQLSAVDTDVLGQLRAEKEARAGVTLGDVESEAGAGVTLGDGESIAIGGTGDDDDIIGVEGQDSGVTVDTGTIGSSDETAGEGDAFGLGDTDTSGVPGVTDGPIVSVGGEGEGLVGTDGTLVGTGNQTGEPNSSGEDGEIAGTGGEGPTIGGGPVNNINLDDTGNDDVTIGSDVDVTIPLYDFGDPIVYDPLLPDFDYRQPSITSPFDFEGMYGSYTLSPEIEQSFADLTDARTLAGFDPASIYEPDYLEVISAMSPERQAEQGIASLIGPRFPGAFGSYPFTSTPEQSAQALIDAMNAREAAAS